MRLLIASSLCLLALWASSAEAVSPEALLSKESVAYLKFDGLAKHGPTFEKTIAAQIVREELKPILDFAAGAIMNALGPEVLSESLLQGTAPDELLELKQASAGVPRSLERLYSHGIAIGVELIQPLEGRWQVTAVFPDAGEEKTRDALLGAFRLLAKASDAEYRKQEVQGRQLAQFEVEGSAKLSCWVEGEHVVLTIGTEGPEQTIALATDKARENLTTASAYQSVQSFERYPTYARGFVDTEGLLSVLSKHFPPANQIGKQLGLAGLKQFAFHLGFEGDYQRSTVELAMPGDRLGLLKVLGGLKTVQTQDLPPVAPGAAYVSVTGLDPAGVYDAFLEAAQIAYQFTNPGDEAGLKGQIEAIEMQLGVQLRADLLGSLDSPVLFYSDPDEGPFSMGTAVAIKVKDADKLASTLKTLIQSIGTLTGVDVSVKENDYRGVGLNVVETGISQFPLSPTYTIHNGWLVAALYPQPVKGYALRAKETAAATWKPSPLLNQVIEIERKFPSPGDVEIVGMTESDPRPTIREILSVAPLFAAMYNSYGASTGSTRFDSSMLPNAQAICERVTPSVSVVVDDGRSIRVESYSTLPLGFQLTGLRSYYMLFLPFAFRF